MNKQIKQESKVKSRMSEAQWLFLEAAHVLNTPSQGCSVLSLVIDTQPLHSAVLSAGTQGKSEAEHLWISVHS